ncbi:sentrin-specific protease 6 [Spea bombifrons]|uniref:sentrin-specific protease 6 n=1 Tax=Spea bombifrons TaxID=233779 RepID=UPI00234A19FA|nr:sentrin-specific protease 6 [Spea bombifrons]
MAGSGDSRFLEALERAQAKKDAGFRNSWTFDNSEDSEGDVERDEANLLNVEESDGVDAQISEQKSRQLRPGTARGLGDVRTYEKRGRGLHLKPLKGNAIGLNMLGTSKKLGENVQNISGQGTMVQGRLFHHTNIQRSSVKTAAQRKEYPPHVQKVENDPSRLAPSQTLDSMQDTKNDSDLETEPAIKRKVQLKRRTSLLETDVSMLHTSQICQREGMEHNDLPEYCVACVKENKNKTKCQSCGEIQRLCKPAASLTESPPLSRPSIHQNTPGEKSVNIGLNTKNFYGSSAYSNSDIGVILKQDSPRYKQYPANGKIPSTNEGSATKGTKVTRLRNTRSSEPNDPIVLSSDDEEDNASTGSANRMESISPRPADPACSSPAPSSGKVEAALKENSFILEHKLCSSPLTIALPRKAKMKDQFGNPVPDTPVKRRKCSSSLEAQCETKPATFTNNICESVILRCRNVRIGTFCRMVVEPVVFCLDFIQIRLEVIPRKAERGFQEIRLKASELIKCEWCCTRKLPVVFLQTVPAACQSLQSQLSMSKDDDTGWYDCRSPNVDEQYIVLIFEDVPNLQATIAFENILFEIGNRNCMSKFFIKVSFDEANGRLVAFTKHTEDIPSRGSLHKGGVGKAVASETRMKLRSAPSPLHFFTDDEEKESGDTHTVFVGPIEKLFVYPPPPAKGGISVTNEDLHCLNEGEFLNDVIIDFYLKYLVLEKLRKDADRIHVFSSFFYKRLNQRERRNLQDTANLTLQQRRHGRVKTWTRHVDIFQKDFIFVPLNEAAHWFLAVICFPGLEKPEYYNNPYYQETQTTLAPVSTSDRENSGKSLSQSNPETCVQGAASKYTPKKTLSKKHVSRDTSIGTVESDAVVPRRSPSVGRHGLRKIDQGFPEADESQTFINAEADLNTKDINGLAGECKTQLKDLDGLHRIQISYSDSHDDSKKTEEEFIDFSDDQDNLDESSDDGGLADDNYTSEAGKWHLKPTFCKQPCILLMDSLRGPSRSTVVKTLREYLEVEWEVRKGSKRSFSKEFMKGSNPRVPQQNNFSDCGVYVLQYVESFFENPIQSFDLPMNLTDWFPEQRMKTKREEIRNVILALHELQNKDKKGQRDLSTTQSAPQEAAEQFVSCGSN